MHIIKLTKCYKQLLPSMVFVPYSVYYTFQQSSDRYISDERTSCHFNPLIFSEFTEINLGPKEMRVGQSQDEVR